MTEISTSSSVLNELSIAQKNGSEKKESDELGQKAFLKLMITQLENQDPLNPKQNGEFIAQLAQFSSVESLDRLNTNFDGFTDNFVANQALQASSLVGRSVSVPAQSTLLEPGGMVAASVDIPASTHRVAIDIYDKSGSLVDQIDVGAQEKGEMVLRWDGQHAEINGELLDWSSSHEEGLPAGEYRFAVNASLDGEMTQLDTHLSANVNSVTVGNNGGLTLNLAGVGAVSLDDVKQFNE